MKTKHMEPLTAQEWKDTLTNNPIADTLDEAKAQVEEVLKGDREGVIIFGGAGLGKDHLVNEAMNRLAGGKFIPANPAQVNDTLTAFHNATRVFDEESGTWRNRKKPLPILFNEAHLIFTSPNNLNVLKLAGRDGSKWWADYKYEETHHYAIELKDGSISDKQRQVQKRGVSLEAGIIGLSNEDLNAPRNAQLQTHLDTVKSRYPAVCIPEDTYSRWEYTVALALQTPFLTIGWRELGKEAYGKKIPLEVRSNALDWFTENAWNMTQVSPRTMMQVIEAMVKPEPRRTRLLNLLLKPEERHTTGNRPLQKQNWSKLRMELNP